MEPDKSNEEKKIAAEVFGVAQVPKDPDSVDVFCSGCKTRYGVVEPAHSINRFDAEKNLSEIGISIPNKPYRVIISGCLLCTMSTSQGVSTSIELLPDPAEQVEA